MTTFLSPAIGTTGNRRALFDDPLWDERFEVLITLTTRTRLIRELMGTDVSEQRIKEEMDRRLLGREGGKVMRPRGAGQSPASKAFLESGAERFDAAYLVGLHFGGRGNGEYSEAETNYARNVDKLIHVYSKYRADAPPSGDTHRISFEVYHLLINGIKSGDIDMKTCSVCNTKHPVPRRHEGLAQCPACATQDLGVSQVKREMDARLAAYRASRNQLAKFG
ncbi:hypothetical protein [Hydrogenophaga sp.]|jgi:hypothetical protein|uniref:hypothetical protein n=1 Tax=Hydrogenophaga sp. TaxID=1904254 RepID=UPI002721F666|nr:hypothetical protein [Hydrogenophaga sp.]MDO9134074.1 hypothetical protein [Hydrogenophaga sp.]